MIGGRITLNMENLARDFDLPITSREHANLAETAWMAGCLVTVRFYLGRLLARNLFRETDAEVEERLVEFISRSTSPEGGNLVRGMSGWDIAGELLRHRFETQTKGASCFKDLYIAAIERFLCNPSLTLAELAKEVGTTKVPRGSARWLLTVGPLALGTVVLAVGNSFVMFSTDARNNRHLQS